MRENISISKKDNVSAFTNSVQNLSTGRTGFYLADNRPQTSIQKKQTAPSVESIKDIPVQKKSNNTGLPDNLKSGIENLSGHSMDDVKVHYNSSQPAQLNAHAYAQGTDIHIASGQERHLAHEAWHVVQQKQGRVKPTMQMKGKVNINDDVSLEKEADVMGSKALQRQSNRNKKQVDFNIVQRTIQMARPVFRSNINKLRRAAKSALGKQKFDLAHRLSYFDINKIVRSGNVKKILKLISAITIPKRNFGKIKKGDLTYYKKVMSIAINPANYNELISWLNSSPFNLRPGNQSQNRANGKLFDPHTDDNGQMTPQSSGIYNEVNDISSTGIDSTTTLNFSTSTFNKYEQEAHS